MEKFEKYLMEANTGKWTRTVSQVAKMCNYSSSDVAQFVEDLLDECNFDRIKYDVSNMIRNV